MTQTLTGGLPTQWTEGLELGRNEIPRMGGKPHYVTGATISAAYGAVRFAWEGRIPVGHVTAIVGEQGAGKSKHTAYLIGTLTGALPNWPDGTPNEYKTGPVLLLETEELRGKYVEIFRHIGVPDDRVIFPAIKDGDPFYTPMLPRDFGMIEYLARECGAVAIVLDSLSGGHGADENDAAMRKILQPLTVLAAKLQIPVIVVHHTRKKSQFETAQLTLDRVRGSSTITQFCRSVIGLYRLEPNDLTATVRVEMLKSSFAAPAKPYGMKLGDLDIEFCDAPEPDKPLTAVDRAVEFLRAQLDHEPQKYDRILEQAEVLGVSKNSLYRAADRLHIMRYGGTWSLSVHTQEPGMKESGN